MLSINLLKRFYESFISDQLIFLLCMDGSKVSGFVLGGDSFNIQRCKKEFVRKNFYRLFIYVLFSPKIYPQVLSRVIKSRVKEYQEKQKMQISITSFRLLSIGIDTEYKRKGIGSSLVNSFEERVKQMGIESYGLSVYKTNKKAISF